MQARCTLLSISSHLSKQNETKRDVSEIGAHVRYRIVSYRIAQAVSVCLKRQSLNAIDR